MAETRQRKEDRRNDSLTPSFKSTPDHSEENNRKTQRNRECEFPSERGWNVPPIDRKRTIKEKRGGSDCEKWRNRKRKASETTKCPTCDRQSEQSTDRNEFERKTVRKDETQKRYRQRREHHVEVVRRKTRIPILGPSRNAERWKQVIAHVGRAPHVRTHIATGRSRRRQDV
ncbi:unannotated protein [freshwater metagenome]|uniref:Unannotated protein n=1 Tax=freshwater metagenome TaxID=449393 RepID=A0A6J6DN34_9ZZZZ